MNFQLFICINDVFVVPAIENKLHPSAKSQFFTVDFYQNIILNSFDILRPNLSVYLCISFEGLRSHYMETKTPAYHNYPALRCLTPAGNDCDKSFSAVARNF